MDGDSGGVADKNGRDRRPVRIDPSDLVLEIVSIVIAIVLATAVGQIISNYQAGIRTREALAQIREEISHDDATLRGVQPLHRRVRSAFKQTLHQLHGEKLDFDAFARVFGDAAPRGFQPFSGTTTAWDVARGSNMLTNVPYDLRATLQTRYGELAQLQTLNAAVLQHLTTTPSERQPNFYFTAFALSLNLSDIVFSEDRLARDDETALRALNARDVH